MILLGIHLDRVISVETVSEAWVMRKSRLFRNSLEGFRVYNIFPLPALPC